MRLPPIKVIAELEVSVNFNVDVPGLIVIEPPDVIFHTAEPVPVNKWVADPRVKTPHVMPNAPTEII